MIKRPPEASRAGKNRYYHSCEAVGSSRHYGVCLFTIEAFERGQQLNETPCVEAMRNGTCPAMAMRQQERDAGESLFYTEPDPEKVVDPKAAQRERNSVDTSHPSYQRGFAGQGWGSDASKNKAKQKANVAKSMPRKRGPDHMLEFDAGALVNDLIENPARTMDDVKNAMLDIGRVCKLRQKQDQEAGRKMKTSVFDYMTTDEKRQFARLKREKDQLEARGAA